MQEGVEPQPPFFTRDPQFFLFPHSVMTTINDLSEEVLYYIFENLDDRDRQTCRNVCRCWYRPAHLLLLKKISFYNELAIEALVESIDYNPDPLYLKAVKALDFYDVFQVRYQFDKKLLRKLFLRFPNLKKVTAHNYSALFKEFDQELCKKIVKGCPKLESFSVTTDYARSPSYDCC